MSLSNQIFLLLLLIPCLLTQKCTPDSSAFTPVSPPSSYNTYLLSPSDEIIKGANFGRLISIGSRIWMMKAPFQLDPSYSNFSDPCPQGWTLPTRWDLENLVEAAGSDPTAVLRSPKFFNMDVSSFYMSNTKAYLNSTNATDAQSWVFYGIKFLASGTPQVTMINSYFQSEFIHTFCVLKLSNESQTAGSTGLWVRGIDQKDLIKGMKYVLSVNNTNVINYNWKLADVQGNTKYLDVIPMKEGLFTLNFKVMMFDGTILGDCRSVWVRNYTGSSGNTSFSLSSIKNVSYPFYKYRNTGLHFSSGSAPFAPKEDGGAYILYAEKDTNFLHVKTILNHGSEVQDLNLSRQGFPFDIVSVGWGWVALIKDFTNPNYLYLLGVDSTNKTVFTRTLMKTSGTPTSANSDQLVFYKDASGTPLFGMEAMFSPSSGKLAYGKQRIALNFAHYNFFGYLSDGTRNDHTGSTVVTFDLNGNDEKIALNWGASHSLTERIIYTGDSFLTASLGDAFPLNVLLAINDGITPIDKQDPKTLLYNSLETITTEDLLPGTITGNGQGFSNGRLGSLIQLADGQTYVVSYARRKSSVVFEGKTISSDINELGLTFFDKNFAILANVKLGEGQNVNQVQSCRYGKNIFISYVISKGHTAFQGAFLDPNINPDDIQYFMLVDEKGKILTGPLLYGSFSTDLPASDEMRMLSDGRCAWTNVDSNGILSYLYLTPPPATPTSFDDVKNSQFYNGGSFYLINSYDLNQYKMGTVESESKTFMNLADLGLIKLSLIASAVKEKKEF